MRIPSALPWLSKKRSGLRSMVFGVLATLASCHPAGSTEGVPSLPDGQIKSDATADPDNKAGFGDLPQMHCDGRHDFDARLTPSLEGVVECNRALFSERLTRPDLDLSGGIEEKKDVLGQMTSCLADPDLSQETLSKLSEMPPDQAGMILLSLSEPKDSREKAQLASQMIAVAESDDLDEDIMIALIEKMGTFGSYQIQVFLQGVTNPSDELNDFLRLKAAAALGGYNNQENRTFLLALAQETEDPDAQLGAILGLGRLPGEEVDRFFSNITNNLGSFGSGYSPVLDGLLIALSGRPGGEKFLLKIAQWAEKNNRDIYVSVLESLACHPGDEVQKVLMASAQKKDLRTKTTSLIALSGRPDSDIEDVSARLLKIASSTSASMVERFKIIDALLQMDGDAANGAVELLWQMAEQGHDSAIRRLSSLPGVDHERLRHLKARKNRL